MLNMGESKDRKYLQKGDTFGILTVISGIRYKTNGGHMYMCQCACGTELKVRMHDLTRKRVASCVTCKRIYKRMKKLIAISE